MTGHRECNICRGVNCTIHARGRKGEPIIKRSSAEYRYWDTQCPRYVAPTPMKEPLLITALIRNPTGVLEVLNAARLRVYETHRRPEFTLEPF